MMIINITFWLSNVNPAKIIGGPEGLGSLKIGGVADVAVLVMQEGSFSFIDSHTVILKGNKQLKATETITRGQLM